MSETERAWRDRKAPYDDEIQGMADEVDDADVHSDRCATMSENDPDACDCSLRYWLERAFAAGRASIPAEPEQADEDRCDDRYQHHPGAPWQRCTGPAFHDGGHISGLPEPEQADEVAGLDVEDCPKCGEWRDSPTADCASPASPLPATTRAEGRRESRPDPGLSGIATAASRRLRAGRGQENGSRVSVHL